MFNAKLPLTRAALKQTKRFFAIGKIMKIEDLEKMLLEMGYRPSAANICGAGAVEGLSISKTVDCEVRYAVFHYERGREFERKHYNIEREACSDFLDRAQRILEAFPDAPYYRIGYEPKTE